MLLPKGIEEAYFRPAANGWVFSAVNPWMIGGRRFYLVSDAQKEALGRCIRRGRPLRLVAILPLLWGALLLAPYLHEPTIVTWTLAGLLILGFWFWLNLADYIAIRGELANLRPTTERLGDMDNFLFHETLIGILLTQGSPDMAGMVKPLCLLHRACCENAPSLRRDQ